MIAAMDFQEEDLTCECAMVNLIVSIRAVSVLLQG